MGIYIYIYMDTFIYIYVGIECKYNWVYHINGDVMGI